jgi:hypothetical protein
MRKLRVLPVPVEAVARMSSPSSAGGMAPAWTGVGVTKPAAARRALRESETSKSAKVMEAASSGVAVMVFATSRGSGFKMESSVRVDKDFPLQ